MERNFPGFRRLLGSCLLTSCLIAASAAAQGPTGPTGPTAVPAGLADRIDADLAQLSRSAGRTGTGSAPGFGGHARLAETQVESQRGSADVCQQWDCAVLELRYTGLPGGPERDPMGFLGASLGASALAARVVLHLVNADSEYPILDRFQLSPGLRGVTLLGRF